MPTAFSARQVFTGTRLLPAHALLVEDGRVRGLVPASEIPPSYRVRDFGEGLLAPALIDLQIYGGNGQLFCAELSLESLQATYESCLSGGCTQFLITLPTNVLSNFLKGIEIVRNYWNSGGRGLLGLHLEGPFINAQKRGAHPLSLIQVPTAEALLPLLEAGKDVIKMITLAPECCDAELIRQMVSRNILVSAGHSNATYAQAMEGFASGIGAATHLFNAMSPLQGREPGLVGAIYDHPFVRCSVVCDGVHVSYPSIRISKQLMGERLFLITDAVAESRHGPYQHYLHADRYTLADGTLSGSALTMIQAVRNAVEKVGIDRWEALRMGALYPARLLGLQDEFGSLEPGARADFMVLGPDLELRQVIEAED